MARKRTKQFKGVAWDSGPLGYGKKVVMKVTPRREGPNRNGYRA